MWELGGRVFRHVPTREDQHGRVALQGAGEDLGALDAEADTIVLDGGRILQQQRQSAFALDEKLSFLPYDHSVPGLFDTSSLESEVRGGGKEMAVVRPDFVEASLDGGYDVDGIAGAKKRAAG